MVVITLEEQFTNNTVGLDVFIAGSEAGTAHSDIPVLRARRKSWRASGQAWFFRSAFHYWNSIMYDIVGLDSWVK